MNKVFLTPKQAYVETWDSPLLIWICSIGGSCQRPLREWQDLAAGFGYRWGSRAHRVPEPSADCSWCWYPRGPQFMDLDDLCWLVERMLIVDCWLLIVDDDDDDDDDDEDDEDDDDDDWWWFWCPSPSAGHHSMRLSSFRCTLVLSDGVVNSQADGLPSKPVDFGSFFFRLKDLKMVWCVASARTTWTCDQEIYMAKELTILWVCLECDGVGDRMAIGTFDLKLGTWV